MQAFWLLMIVPVTLLRAPRALLSLTLPDGPHLGPLPRSQGTILAQPGPRVPVPSPVSGPASVGSWSPGQWAVWLAASSGIPLRLDSEGSHCVRAPRDSSHRGSSAGPGYPASCPEGVPGPQAPRQFPSPPAQTGHDSL